MEVAESQGSRLVIVGHGPAGHRLVEALRARDTAERWQVTVLGEEVYTAYDRVALTSYLTDDAELGFPDHDEDVAVLTGDPVVAIDRTARTVITRTGANIGYDVLVLATGSAPFVPPGPGRAGSGGGSDLARLRRFVSFVNAPDTPDPSIAFEPERDQIKPVLVAGPQLEVVTR